MVVNVHFKPDLYRGICAKDFAVFLFIGRVTLKPLVWLLVTSIFASPKRRDSTSGIKPSQKVTRRKRLFSVHISACFMTEGMKKANQHSKKNTNTWNTMNLRDWINLHTNCSDRWAHKHFLWTMEGPDSSNLPFEVHICWKFQGPYRVLSLGWSNHFDLHRGWSQRRQFLRHAKKPLEHGRAPWQKYIDVQILADVHVTTFGATVTMFSSGSTKVFSKSISAVDLNSVSWSKLQ